MIRLIVFFVLLMVLAPFRAEAKAKDHLVIGITQFPSTFHPNIDSMLAKTYILAMTRRPFTIYDVDWKNVCLLCITLPTIENLIKLNLVHWKLNHD